MGYWSDKMIEMQEDEAKDEWIRDHLENLEADESDEEWQRLESEYYDLLSSGELYFDEAYYTQDYPEDWDIEGKTKYEIFSETINNSSELLNIHIESDLIRRNLLVMLFGHVVAAVEAYLSSTFIQTVMSSEQHIKSLVETDPIFAKQKFSMKEIFVTKENLENTIKQYLLDIIFHDIKKIKPMYKSVLDIDFGNVSWLFEAVTLRHDCVHRAGYNKEGNEIDLNESNVKSLIENSEEFISTIESGIKRLTVIDF